MTYRIRIPKLNLTAPPYKLRSEKETEELLHRYKVIARKHQIQDIKNDLKNCQHWNMETYCQADRRKELFRLGREYMARKVMHRFTKVGNY